MWRWHVKMRRWHGVGDDMWCWNNFPLPLSRPPPPPPSNCFDSLLVLCFWHDPLRLSFLIKDSSVSTLGDAPADTKLERLFSCRQWKMKNSESLRFAKRVSSRIFFFHEVFLAKGSFESPNAWIWILSHLRWISERSGHVVALARKKETQCRECGSSESFEHAVKLGRRLWCKGAKRHCDHF